MKEAVNVLWTVLVLFAGISDGLTLLNDLWMYDFSSYIWMELEPATKQSWLPPSLSLNELDTSSMLSNTPNDAPPPPPMQLAPGRYVVIVYEYVCMKGGDRPQSDLICE